MKNWKRNAFCLLLTAMVCLLAACGKEEATPDDAVAGDDWRTTGIVDDYGTITRDGTDTDVCIVVREDDTTFYYDEHVPVRVLPVEYQQHPDISVGVARILDAHIPLGVEAVLLFKGFQHLAAYLAVGEFVLHGLGPGMEQPQGRPHAQPRQQHQSQRKDQGALVDAPGV